MFIRLATDLSCSLQDDVDREGADRRHVIRQGQGEEDQRAWEGRRNQRSVGAFSFPCQDLLFDYNFTGVRCN